MIVVVAEKPSVARELAGVLGASTRRQGYLEGGGYQVTWAIGHLVGIADPAEMDPEWKTWSRAALPMLPRQWKLRVLDNGRDQYAVVQRLLRAASAVVAATDAGREGELIFRLIYELAACKATVQRLWLSSMTVDAIRTAFARLEPSSRYDGLAAAALARARADWLVGMNFSRAYTLSRGALSSVGRVQTPTLAMVVARDEAIRIFKPQPFLEVEATFTGASGSYKGTYYRPPPEGLRDDKGRLRAFKVQQARLPADGQLAQVIAKRVRAGSARVLAVECQPKRTLAPMLYDLTELQRHANQLYGYSAQRTLDAAQALYERHKALSYPRTDSRHLSSSVAQTLAGVVRAIAPSYVGLVADGSGVQPLGKRFVDDSEVRDHHALIPTEVHPSLPPDSPEARIYDLVCRRLLMAWHTELVEGVTRVLTEVSEAASVSSSTTPDLFATSGTSVEKPGWTVLEPRARTIAEASAATKIPGGLVANAQQRVTALVIHRKQTQPPKPHTEATLLTAMETAGKEVSDRELSAAMRDAGLGTPATRAATIEKLLSHGYLSRKGKALIASADGVALVRTVHPLVRSAEMTGAWELRLRRIERGEEAVDGFMRELAAYVQEVVAEEAKKPALQAPRSRAPQPARSCTAGTRRSR